MEKWIAVYTKSRHEKVVIQELEKNDIEAYCPILKERRQWSDRKRWVEFPLFRSYVFAKIELKNSLYILRTIGVHHIVKFQGNISTIPDEIIQNIKSNNKHINTTNQTKPHKQITNKLAFEVPHHCLGLHLRGARKCTEYREHPSGSYCGCWGSL